MTIVALLPWTVGRAQAQAIGQDSQNVASFTLEAGATCLERGRLLARIARWRERAALDPGIRVDVRGDPRDAKRVFFYVARGDGERTERVLERAPSDCDQLHSAVALSIALAVDAALSAAHAGAMPAGEAPAQRPAPPRADAPLPLHLDLALQAGASMGVLPDASWVAAPRLQLTLSPWFVVALEGLWTRATGMHISDVPGGFDAQVLAAGLDVCVGGDVSELLSFLSCVGARAGVFSARGFGYSPGDDSTMRWLSVAASGQGRVWLLPMLGLGLSVEALFTPNSRSISVTLEDTDMKSSTRVPQIGLAVSAGPVIRFF